MISDLAYDLRQLLPHATIRTGRRVLLIELDATRRALTEGEAEDLTRWLTGTDSTRAATAQIERIAKTYELE